MYYISFGIVLFLIAQFCEDSSRLCISIVRRHCGRVFHGTDEPQFSHILKDTQVASSLGLITEML